MPASSFEISFVLISSVSNRRSFNSFNRSVLRIGQDWFEHNVRILVGGMVVDNPDIRVRGVDRIDFHFLDTRLRSEGEINKGTVFLGIIFFECRMNCFEKRGQPEFFWLELGVFASAAISAISRSLKPAVEKFFFQISSKSGGRVPVPSNAADSPVQFEFLDFERYAFGEDKTGDIGDLVNIDNLLICVRDLLRSSRIQNRIFYRLYSEQLPWDLHQLSQLPLPVLFHCGGAEWQT